jgi:hypothetical protein
MASSRALIEALEDNSNNNVVDGGMDALPTAPLPFFNQHFSERNAQLSSSNFNINNSNDNYNNDDIDL